MYLLVRIVNQLILESSGKLDAFRREKKRDIRRAIYLNDMYEYIVRAHLFSPALQTNAMKRVWNTNYVKAAVNTVARSNSAFYLVNHTRTPCESIEIFYPLVTA